MNELKNINDEGVSSSYLGDKDSEIKMIADNIFGGVEICRYDKDFTIVYANKGFFDLTGYSPEEVESLLGNKHNGLVLKDDIEIIGAQISEQLKTQDSFTIEYRMVRKDGKIIWVLDKGILINSEKFDTLVQCTLTDITEQKKAEDDLKISKKQYEVAMRYSDITMFEYNIITKEIIMIERDADLFGFDQTLPDGPDSIANSGLILPEYVEGYLTMYEKIHSGQKTASCIIDIKDSDGKNHEYEVTLINIFDDLGNPIRAVGVRKKLTESL